MAPPLLLEIERLVAAGLTYRLALAATTSAPRALMGRGPGAIRAGEEASFLILSSNPALDVAALRRLDWIVLKGTMRRAPPRRSAAAGR